MKWKNIDTGAGYYCVTGTITQWLPLFSREEMRRAVCYEINVALRRFGGSMCAYVIMPDHLHLLVHLPEDGQLHRFCKCWRGRSARRIVDILIARGDVDTLAILREHANGACKYAAWKEQARALGMLDEAMLRQKVDYIHANPVRRGLVDDPGDWPQSSWRYYAAGEVGDFAIVPAA